MPGQNGAAIGIRVSRPSIAVNERVEPDLADGLLSLTIVERTTGLFCCEAQFGNWGNKDNSAGFLYFDRKLLDFGKPFAVKLGQDTMFDGRIVGLEAVYPAGEQPRLTVLAEDAFQDLRMTRRTRSFTNLSDADVIRQVAGDHGLTAQVDLSGPTYKVLAQVNQSDLAFLRERVRAVDGELWMEKKTLHAVARSRRNGGTLKMGYGRTLRQFCVLADLAGQRSSVTVSGWDVGAKAALKEQADDSSITNELHGDTSGASVLSSALGQRKEALVHTVPLDGQTARAEAEAYFRMNARRFVVGRGTA